MAEEAENMQTTAALNKAINDFNALKIRLDTQPLIDRLEVYLKGEKEGIVQDEEGNIRNIKVEVGKPLANQKGIQNIMSWVMGIVNTQTVQGNFPVDKHGYSFNYEQEICEFREQFGFDLVLNIYEWEVNEDEAEGIIDRACQTVRVFLSRCIGNEERKSYGETMRTIESNLTRQKSGMQFFKR